MIHNKINIQVDGSLESSALYTYIIDYSEEFKWSKRPVVIICPGGGYRFTSDREAEIIALQFNAMGYHSAVLRYSCAPAVYPTALLELSKAVSILREHAKEWYIDPDAVIVSGFSAGGHLAANFSVSWNSRLITEQTNTSPELYRPDGLILCYPVITSGEYAHRDSFKNLLGNKYDKLIDEVSLEKKVNSNVPRTFIWHTCTDGTVPVQNSTLFANALIEQHISTELHIFEQGGHGLGLANRLTQGQNGKGLQPGCEKWIDLVKEWLNYYCR